MEQLTEFVSKSFSAERLALMTPNSVMTTSSSSSSSLTPSSSSSHPFSSGGHSTALPSLSGLPFFRTHPHSFDPRLSLPPHLTTGLSFFNPALFGVSSLFGQHQACAPSMRPSFPPIDLSLVKTTRDDTKSPSLSPGRRELCLSQASVTDADSRQSSDEASGEEDVYKTASGKKSSRDSIFDHQRIQFLR
jgi:hypothetical protein